jgi:hypothetical protein
VSTERVRRDVILSRISQLDGEEAALRAQRSLTTYRLEQVISERERLRHRLAESPSEETIEGG